jgi:hypothetical protein
LAEIYRENGESYDSPNANLIGGHKILGARQSRIDIFLELSAVQLEKKLHTLDFGFCARVLPRIE